MLFLQGAEAGKALLKGQPIFTSFSYNIHGNEASSTEAAMQVAYRMAAAQDDETEEVLKNSVIIMYICINPDGRDRYVYWYKSMKRLKRPSNEPQDIEHMEGWPGGRTNHYWFDINRDWVWQVHPEARGLSEEYQKWLPQVHVDYHEQGYNNNYFTAPGTTPRNQLLPDMLMKDGPKFLGMQTSHNLISIRSIILQGIVLISFIQDMDQVIRVLWGLSGC